MTVEIQSVIVNGEILTGFAVAIWRDSVTGDWISSVIEQTGDTPAAPEVLIDSVLDSSGVKIPGKMSVNFTVNGVLRSQNIDQTTVPIPASPDLFYIPEENWRRMRNLQSPPGGGPYTIPLGKARDNGRVMPGDNLISLGVTWQSWIQSLNPDPVSWAFYINPGGGPTKGIDSTTGMMKYLGLAYPGPGNVVKIMRNASGALDIHTNDGIDWCRIDSIPLTAAPDVTITSEKKPWVFGQFFTGAFGQHLVKCPMIGGPWWIPMGFVTKV